MPDPIEHFLEDNEIMKDFLRMFQVLFYQQLEVKYLFRT